MSVQVEKLEHNMAKLTIEVSAEELDKAMNTAYNKQKKSISIPGFRKGKVPRAMIEKMYGPEIFYEEAANTLMQQTYGAAVDECGEDIVSRPDIDVVQLEKGKTFIYTAEVAVKPDVDLGEYRGITVTAGDTSVTDEEVETEIKKEAEKNARTVEVTDRALQMGDTAVIDFEGFVDGTAFEGGKGENHELVLGSHSFIDTFEEQLVGKNIGEEAEVNVTFPEDYQADDLAGKAAVFQVKVNAIKAKEVPMIDDEFAAEVSEFDTLDAYKADVRKNLEEKKAAAVKNAQQEEAIDKIVAASTMDIPDAMLDTQCETMMDDFRQRLTQSGLTMDQYLQFSGQTMDEMKEQVKPEAMTRIRTSLVLEKIALVENLEASDEDLDKQIEEMAKSYGMEADKLKSYMGESEKKSMKDEMKITKAIDFIMENAVIVAAE